MKIYSWHKTDSCRKAQGYIMTECYLTCRICCLKRDKNWTEMLTGKLFSKKVANVKDKSEMASS